MLKIDKLIPTHTYALVYMHTYRLNNKRTILCNIITLYTQIAYTNLGNIKNHIDTHKSHRLSVCVCVFVSVCVCIFLNFFCSVIVEITTSLQDHRKIIGLSWLVSAPQIFQYKQIFLWMKIHIYLRCIFTHTNKWTHATTQLHTHHTYMLLSEHCCVKYFFIIIVVEELM